MPLFGQGDVVAEPLEEDARILHAPTHEHLDENDAGVQGGGLLVLALEVADAVVEPVQALDRPGQRAS